MESAIIKGKKMKCIICKEKITPDPDGWEGGHNAEPIAEGRCCGDCNWGLVTPARLFEFQYKKGAE